MAYAETRVTIKDKSYRVIWCSNDHFSKHTGGYTVYKDNGALCKNKINTGCAISAFQREMERLFSPGEASMNARLQEVLKTI